VNDKQEEIDTQSRQYRRKIDEIETRCKTLEKSNAELRVDVNTKNEIIDDIQVKLEKRGSEVEGLETELLRVKAQTGDLETLKVLKKELSELVNYIKTLEGTNRRQLAELKSLRETNKSLELVEEEKRALENKVNVLDDVRQDLSAALVRLSILQDERATWESYFQSEGLEFDSPASMARALVEERIEKAVLLEKAGRSNPDIIQKEEVIGELQEELQVVRRELDGCKESLSKDNKARQRLERQRGLALREAQFLREQLKSFTTEESIHMEGSYDKQKTQHVQQLEELLEAYKTEMEKLKAEMLESGIEIVPEINKKRQLDESINDERLGELTRRNRQLQEGK
jgi:mitotic spindle assembly checkpoint protein MAD1